MENTANSEINNIDAPVRLNKFLSERGICSRREADRLIEEGKVCVDGITAVPGLKVTSDQVITVEGNVISQTPEKVILIFNKPEGIECTTDLDNKDNIVSFIGYPDRIYPIGRLDKASSGLILLTNDGSIVNAILRSENDHEKEYEVMVDKDITDDFLQNMEKGVFLKDVPIRNKKDSTGKILRINRDITTKPCKINKIDTRSFKIVLKQGINRQIRRMCRSLGYNVTSLKRVRIMNLEITGLDKGKYRKLSTGEIDKLLNQLK